MDRPLAPSGGRTAVVALATGILVASCIVQTEPPPQGPPPPGGYGEPEAQAGDQEDPGGLADGDYACSIESDGYRYPPFRCTIYTADDGSRLLEKVGGSQRFRGRVMPEEGGFGFEGTFFCPYGDCTEEVSARFAAVGDRQYQGTLESKSGPLNVSLQHMPGGFTYGGARYGGATYAGRPPVAPPPQGPPPQ